ncbi:MAG: phosphoribosylformylglycinamidine synthase subunit PurL [Candidatus Symbiobacter sp.]|nr:phosphoribosylformylglycinamidine synthase subunit PurL [Candidatus Symbiobacter sp.]
MEPQTLTTLPPDQAKHLARSFGLNEAEYGVMTDRLGRQPTLTELGIFAVMWSEHCAYKSSRRHLKQFPTTGKNVICGPGENAGVVDIGDGDALVFKIESHNHPSFIEPYQGAATGVGGIMRDIFTMGARPIANLNAIRFGDWSQPRTRELLAGVVAGIGGYGNSMGVPTVAGETQFDRSYTHNILVNAMTVGIARADRIFYAKAAGVGNDVVYVGAKTGRDGIHGATMASAEFNSQVEAKRPTVQVGDPYTEKRLLEACLELMATDAVIAIQDMGAAGLTSSSVEMASKGGLGIHLRLDQVPLRDANLSAYEIMLSESQERMLMILRPGATAAAQKIFAKWDLDAAVIGVLTDDGMIRIDYQGKTEAFMPLAPLVDESPQYDRPAAPPQTQTVFNDASLPPPPPEKLLPMLAEMLGKPDFCGKDWITQQFDSLVGGQVVMSNATDRRGDAAVVRIDGSKKGVAMNVVGNPHYCAANAKRGGEWVVLEAWRKLTATGATPIALTNNLNFGNPERPEIMRQFIDAIAGMSAACQALDLPIVSGNVSLYNETDGVGIMPTPVVGGVGVLSDYRLALPKHITGVSWQIFALSFPRYHSPRHHEQKRGYLGASAWRRIFFPPDFPSDSAAAAAAPPEIDYGLEIAFAQIVRQAAQRQIISACHAVGAGGLFMALAKMLLGQPHTNIGARISLPSYLLPHIYGFGEGVGGYLIAINPRAAKPRDFLALCDSLGVKPEYLGISINDSKLSLPGLGSISLADLARPYFNALPGYMDRAAKASG